MTTLVMGGTGFVGMNLVEALLESGEDVVAFGSHDLPPTGREWLARRGGRLRVVRGDIRDRASIDAAFRIGRVDRLWHGAVITAGTEREATDFQTIIDVNLKATATVIEAARDHGVGRIVYPSTNTWISRIAGYRASMEIRSARVLMASTVSTSRIRVWPVSRSMAP